MMAGMIFQYKKSMEDFVAGPAWDVYQVCSAHENFLATLYFYEVGDQYVLATPMLSGRLGTTWLWTNNFVTAKKRLEFCLECRNQQIDVSFFPYGEKK